MLLNSVRAQSDELDPPLREFWLEFGECAQLCGADGSEVLGVRKEDNPAIAFIELAMFVEQSRQSWPTDELVEVYLAIRGLGIEVGRYCAQAKRSWSVRHVDVRTCSVM